MLITACGNMTGLGPVTTSTSLPTNTSEPTETSTQMPTATPLPSPTATEVLSPQEKLNQEYRDLVPLDEKCVKSTSLTMSYDDIQPGTEYLELYVHAATPENPQNRQITLGPPQDPTVIDNAVVLPVVCRDNNNNIFEFLLNLGGPKQGVGGSDQFDFTFTHQEQINANTVRFSEKTITTTAHGVLGYLKKGDATRVLVPIKPGTGPFREGSSKRAQLAELSVKYPSSYLDSLNLLSQENFDALRNLGELIITPALVYFPVETLPP